jgi:hypothetical protein
MSASTTAAIRSDFVVIPVEIIGAPLE